MRLSVAIFMTITLLSGTLLSGCVSIPFKTSYFNADAPDESNIITGNPTSFAPVSRWWGMFGDSFLHESVHLGLKNWKVPAQALAVLQQSAQQRRASPVSTVSTDIPFLLEVPPTPMSYPETQRAIRLGLTVEIALAWLDYRAAQYAVLENAQDTQSNAALLLAQRRLEMLTGQKPASLNPMRRHPARVTFDITPLFVAPSLIISTKPLLRGQKDTPELATLSGDYPVANLAELYQLQSVRQKNNVTQWLSLKPNGTPELRKLSPPVSAYQNRLQETLHAAEPLIQQIFAIDSRLNGLYLAKQASIEATQAAHNRGSLAPPDELVTAEQAQKAVADALYATELQRAARFIQLCSVLGLTPDL